MQRAWRMVTRREFIHGAAYGLMHGVLSATAVLVGGGCWSTTEGEGERGAGDGGAFAISGPNEATIACDGIGARSSATGAHTHDVCVPSSDLTRSPSGGVSYTTTNVEGHSHRIELDAAQLAALERGEIVRATTSSETASGVGSETAHVHTFTLARSETLAPARGV